MKIRSTIEDFCSLSRLGRMCPNSPLSCVRISVSQVAPPPDDRMAHSRVSDSPRDSDFNQLSISDMRSFRQFKDMDVMHKADSVARYVNRGRKLSDFLKRNGTNKFLGHYSKD